VANNGNGERLILAGETQAQERGLYSDQMKAAALALRAELI
jgi:hypothetical protein